MLLHSLSRTACATLALLTAAFAGAAEPTWKSLPEFKPEGRQTFTGAYVLRDRDSSDWQPPKFVYDADVATKPKVSKVVVVIYNPVLESEGGKTMIEYLGANDPRKFSHILANVIHVASGGYITYELEFIEVDGYSEKADGYRYTDETFLAVRRKEQKHHEPDRSSYRKIFEENGLIERVKSGEVREVWLWGAGYFGYDELAMYIPKRYARFAPTDNPWFYRPYDIPEEVGRTCWVMGFNYEVGADNMIHSYAHRVESILALQLAHGRWDKKLRGEDPWNTFSSLEMDHEGKPSHVGNCHVPPNGQQGYDYNNKRSVLSYADNWLRYPDLSGPPRMIDSGEWNHSQYGFQVWWHSHLPKAPGYTKWGYNNWWVYIANTDEDLPDREIPDKVRGMADPDARQTAAPATNPPVAQQASDTTVVVATNDADLIAAGEKLYRGKGGCKMCHTIDGQRGMGSTFKGLFGSTVESNKGVQRVADEAFLHESIVAPEKHISKGYAPMMASYAKTLSDQEIDALIAYIRSLQ